MNPEAPKPRMGPYYANMNEGDGEEGKYVPMPRGLYTQPPKRGSYNQPGILIRFITHSTHAVVALVVVVHWSWDGHCCNAPPGSGTA